MKGLKIERARPNNAIDIYALLSQAVTEGILPGKPTQRQIKSYYFAGLLNELASPAHIWVIAKRGRGYLGFAHAALLPGRWDGQIESVFVDLVFVSGHRRKHGIGRKLLDEIKKEVENLGIKRVEFLCPSDQMHYWSKERSANAKQVFMEVNL